MKVLLCITGLQMGGAERVVVNLANALVEIGLEVHLLYLNGKNKQDDRIDGNVTVIPLKMSKSPIGLVIGLFKLCRIISAVRPDVVHGHMYHANIMIRLARIFVSFPRLISTEHSKFIGSKIRMLLYRVTDSLSDINTNVSKEAIEEFIEKKAFSKGKSIYVYNGVNVLSFSFDPKLRTHVRRDLGLLDTAFVFLHVGRLTAAKDQETLINSFASFHSQCQNTHLIIVGEGENKEKLKSLAELHEIADAIHFVGITKDVEMYYSASDCFVLSSKWEGFGLVIAEAMASGLPVITTNAGGCAEVLDNPSYVAEVGDFEGIKRLMEKVYNLTPDDRVALKNRYEKSVMRFDQKAIVQLWLKIYEV